MVSQKNKGILLKPAIKGVMGDWTYYVSSMTYKQIEHYVKRPDEIYESKQLSDMIQRRLSSRYQGILDYLSTEKERFFNSIVLAVYKGKTKWSSYQFEEENSVFRTVGLLKFDGDEEIFPVDGQHRVEAIKKMVELGSSSDDEEVPVIFISHDPENLVRTRRLFTTLNRYAKPVDISDTIALDEDDIVAIVTRYQVERFSLLKGRIKCVAGENMDNDNKYYIAIETLYKCNESLFKGYYKERSITDSISEFRRFRKSDDIINDFYDYCCCFWNNLVDLNEDVKDYFFNNSIRNARSKNGGNLLFRPYALKCYIDALVWIKNKYKIDYVISMGKLSSYSFDLNATTWNRGILWNSNMVTGKKSLIKNIFVLLFDATFLTNKQRESIRNTYSSCQGIKLEDVDDSIFQRSSSL